MALAATRSCRARARDALSHRARIAWRVAGYGLLALAVCGWIAATAHAQAPAADGGAFSFEAVLDHAAYRMPGAPSVIVHAPAGFDAHKPLRLVVFLHGYSGCVRVLMGQGPSRCRPNEAPHEGWDLGRVHDEAHTNTLFVVPQLAYMQRNGRPGAFAQPGVFRAFLEELIAGPLTAALGAARSLRDVASVTLIAHSAGYEAALAILEHGGLGKLVQDVVLLDALYGETPRFAHYVEVHAPRGLRFVSLALHSGTPHHENQVLLTRLRRSLGHANVVDTDAEGLARAVTEHAIVIGEGAPPHRLLPATHLAELLRALAAARR